MNWLFLRGARDERTEKSIRDDDDMWLQLFAELVNNNDYGQIYFESEKNVNLDYKHLKIANFFTGGIVGDNNIIFSRGGFDWQANICKKYLVE